MSSTDDLTMVRATKKAAKRIDRAADRLSARLGGRWSRPAVIDKAMDCLEREMSAQATETHTP